VVEGGFGADGVGGKGDGRSIVGGGHGDCWVVRERGI
jgi:hypothetical protein